jgi:hypothetical protein
MPLTPDPPDVVPLPFPFTRGGYSHVLLARAGPWCIVRRTWIEDGKPHLPHYEIVRLHHRAERKWPDGRVTPALEAYPQPSRWGRDAWSMPTLRHAGQHWEALRSAGEDLPEWVSLGIPEDEEGYRAWQAGRLPRVTL